MAFIFVIIYYIFLYTYSHLSLHTRTYTPNLITLLQVPDDVTSETLAVAAGSTKDKKKRQELKNTGQSYVNTKGKLVDAKRVWPQDCSRCVCVCVCVRGCKGIKRVTAVNRDKYIR